MRSSATILGIETSCDDTCVAICTNGKILSNIISSQFQHDTYGGVVPEMASRLHLENIQSIFKKSLKDSRIDMQTIDAIAFTNRPGLLGSLLVGAGFAKGLSIGLSIPLIAINHIQAHVISNMIDNPSLTFPFICLTASGGHTILYICHDTDNIEEIGKTRDDSAGETLDKIGKMLGLPFPAGKHIDQLAQKGNSKKFKFPFVNLEEYDYSFSGLKTSVLYFLQKNMKNNPSFIQENIYHLCASIQECVVDILLHKLLQLYHSTQIKNVCISGGLSANSVLRKKMQIESENIGFSFFSPSFSYCTDNAAMIAYLGYIKYLKKDFSPLTTECYSS